MFQNRRSFVKALGNAGIVLFSAPALAINNTNYKKKLTVLHTNDLHSQIDANDENHPEYPGMGGFARRAALVNKIRKEEENVLLLDAGDLFQGSPYFNFFKGELEIKLMNSMKYDAATLGNHEFDNGADMLFEQLDKATHPILSANYEFENPDWQDIVKPYVIKQYGNLKVGILGVSIDPKGLISPANFKGIKYKDEIEVANNIAKELKENEACDFIIALTHLGIETDVKLAEQSNDIDMILGGHSHTFMEEPMLVNNLKNSQVIINQMGWAGVYLGRIDLYFDESGSEHVAERIK